MDRLAYVAMTGARQTMIAQGVISNNLANLSTPGYRAELVGSDTVAVRGSGFASRLNAVASGFGANMGQGAIRQTGNTLDLAIKGEGWLAVQGADGNEAYTRAGDLRVDGNGLLLTGSGHPVMGNAGPVAIPPHSDLVLGDDGTISIVPLGQGPETLAVIDRLKLVGPDSSALERGSDGLFRLRDGAAADADANVKVTWGALEGSNVSAAGTLVDMIELQRLYETQVKLISTARDNADAAAALMRVR